MTRSTTSHPEALSGLCTYRIRVDQHTTNAVQAAWLASREGSTVANPSDAPVFLLRPEFVDLFCAEVKEKYKGRDGIWLVHAERTR